MCITALIAGKSERNEYSPVIGNAGKILLGTVGDEAGIQCADPTLSLHMFSVILGSKTVSFITYILYS
jgi:hypothetical protein